MNYIKIIIYSSMVLLYDLFFILFGLLYMPYAVMKGKFSLDGFLIRMGMYPEGFKNLLGSKPIIWLHAVSVGEIGAIKGLVDLVKKEYPDYTLIISTVTRTGNSLAKKLFSDAIIIYLPFDISFIVWRAVSLIQPKVFILCETELWPNIILALAQKKVPIILLNGRLSDSSFKGYKLISPFLRPILNRVSLFCMQTEQYRERMRVLGVQESRIKVTGNMKFDIDMPSESGLTKTLQEFLAATEQLFIAASTHPGEEPIIMRVYKKLLNTHQNLRLLIAPRHIERAGEVERLSKMCGFESLRLSMLNSYPLSIIHYPLSVFLLDTIGGLASLYRMTTIVFIGGSLIKHGGHNPIEPAIFQKPIISGNYVSNFRDVYDVFLKNDAAMLVRNEQELFDSAKQLLDNKALRTSLGFCARRVVEENRGATRRNLEILKGFLEH